jgi:O-antigen/teichoic acid export membrane protein
MSTKGTLIRLGRAVHIGTTGALLGAAALQAASFFLLARGLGVESFGSFMIVAAVTQLAVDAVALGAGESLIRRVSRDRSEFGDALGHALIMTFSTVPLVGVVAWAVIHYSTSTLTAGVAAVFVLGELTGVRLSALSEHALLAHSMTGAANVVRILASAARLVVVLLAFHVFSVADVNVWSLVQGLTTLATGILAATAVMLALGHPRLRFHRDDLSFGALVSLNQLAATLQLTADRYLLGLTSPAAFVGVYAAGTRALQLAFLPVSAIMRNLYVRFFAVGSTGIQAAWQLSMQNLRVVGAVGLAIAILLFLTADLYALLFGPGFEQTADIVRALSLVPFLKGVQSLMADALSGAGYQSTRTGIAVAGSALFLLSMVAMATTFGIWGAVLAVYVQQVGLLICYWSFARRMITRTRREVLTGP